MIGNSDDVTGKETLTSFELYPIRVLIGTALGLALFVYFMIAALTWYYEVGVQDLNGLTQTISVIVSTAIGLSGAIVAIAIAKASLSTSRRQKELSEQQRDFEVSQATEKSIAEIIAGFSRQVDGLADFEVGAATAVARNRTDDGALELDRTTRDINEADSKWKAGEYVHIDLGGFKKENAEVIARMTNELRNVVRPAVDKLVDGMADVMSSVYGTEVYKSWNWGGYWDDLCIEAIRKCDEALARIDELSQLDQESDSKNGFIDAQVFLNGLKLSLTSRESQEYSLRPMDAGLCIARIKQLSMALYRGDFGDSMTEAVANASWNLQHNESLNEFQGETIEELLIREDWLDGLDIALEAIRSANDKTRFFSWTAVDNENNKRRCSLKVTVNILLPALLSTFVRIDTVSPAVAKKLQSNSKDGLANSRVSRLGQLSKSLTHKLQRISRFDGCSELERGTQSSCVGERRCSRFPIFSYSLNDWDVADREELSPESQDANQVGAVKGYSADKPKKKAAVGHVSPFEPRR